MAAVVPGSPRKRYYNPVLDPDLVSRKMSPAMAASVNSYESGGPLNTPDAAHPANLVSSLCEDGLHRPALDIDIPVRVVESSTPGHCHLYFDTVALTWPQYVALLGALTAAGIIEDGYLHASLSRGQTLLRPEGQQRALPRNLPGTGYEEALAEHAARRAARRPVEVPF